MLLFSGSANVSLATKVAAELDIPLAAANISRFPDGETQIHINTPLKGKHAFIIQSISPPVNDNLIELCLMSNALRRAGAKAITLIAPYIGYMRQDYAAAKRGEPLGSEVVASLINACQIDRLITVDLHSSRSAELFSTPILNLSSQNIFAHDVLNKQIPNPIIVAPDVGGALRARNFAKLLNLDLAVIQKLRTSAARTVDILGNVQNRNCIIIDDIIDSASTICNATHALKAYGAQRIFIYATHAVFSAYAARNIARSYYDEIVITDTIELQNTSLNCNNLRQISVVPMLAEVLKDHITVQI
ncbi:MAG TPA: ribose-phosphate diphosphokinase [Gammaproteobacteria bacterium]|nr:ribose-phosphate diphosphokinase [Gammaproteobacteria bacterium]